MRSAAGAAGGGVSARGEGCRQRRWRMRRRQRFPQCRSATLPEQPKDLLRRYRAFLAICCTQVVCTVSQARCSRYIEIKHISPVLYKLGALTKIQNWSCFIQMVTKYHNMHFISTCTICNGSGAEVRCPGQLPRVVMWVRGVVAMGRGWSLHDGVWRAGRRVVHPTPRPASGIFCLIARVPIVL